MANRNFPSNKLYNPHVQPVMLDAQVLIGASGAVTSFTGKYVTSVTKTATGTYSIQLNDNYAAMYQIIGSMQVSSGTSGISNIEQVGTLTNSTNPIPGNGATVVIQTVEAGTVANPASGSTINLMFYLNSSQVQ